MTYSPLLFQNSGVCNSFPDCRIDIPHIYLDSVFEALSNDTSRRPETKNLYKSQYPFFLKIFLKFEWNPYGILKFSKLSPAALNRALITEETSYN
uniref:Uncharacterized protein n=1 Tax=Meloidogyne enterolobii TaxID=390850 RepID=A0A6V7UBB9_MELEN|nr:unnamed protein product [Meloidogyne enterolobii]